MGDIVDLVTMDMVDIDILEDAYGGQGGHGGYGRLGGYGGRGHGIHICCYFLVAFYYTHTTKNKLVSGSCYVKPNE